MFDSPRRAVRHFLILQWLRSGPLVIFAIFSDPGKQDLTNIYKDMSTILWNGTPCRGLSAYHNLLRELPATSHRIESIDCHPIPSGMCQFNRDSSSTRFRTAFPLRFIDLARFISYLAF
jgi:hypothetical protein